MLWLWEEPVAAVVNHFQGCEGNNGDGEMEFILPALEIQHEAKEQSARIWTRQLLEKITDNMYIYFD